MKLKWTKICTILLGKFSSICNTNGPLKCVDESLLCDNPNKRNCAELKHDAVYLLLYFTEIILTYLMLQNEHICIKDRLKLFILQASL